jgi:hypothetical protein
MFEELLRELTLMQDCENPSTTYLCIGSIRLIFHDGKYVGWYRP